MISLAAFLLLGVALACSVIFAAASKAVIARLSVVTDNGLGPVYLALVLTLLAHHAAGAQLRAVSRPTRVEMPDGKVYRVLDGGPGLSGALVMANDGGTFAGFVKSQRAMLKLQETLPLFLALLLPMGFVLPWASVGLSVLFGLARAIAAADAEASAGRKLQLVSLAAEGVAGGVCLIVGIMCSAQEIIAMMK